MSRLFILHGASNSGKDTAATIIGGANIKWSGLMKRTFESWYGHPVGSWEDREFRTTCKLPCGKTPLEVMVAAYKAWDNIDEGLTARPTARVIQSTLKDGVDVCLTDTRKLIEADLICEVANATSTHVVALHLWSDDQVTLEVDKHIQAILDRILLGCRDITWHSVHNDKTKSFYTQIADITDRANNH